MPSYVPLSCYDLLKRQRRLEKETRNDIFDEDEEVEEEGAYDVAKEPGEVDEEEFQDNFEDFHLPDPHLGGDLGAIAVEQVEVEAENDSLSYEELLARRMEEFLTKSREAMKSSELSQKVASWHQMIGPRLGTHK